MLLPQRIVRHSYTKLFLSLLHNFSCSHSAVNVSSLQAWLRDRDRKYIINGGLECRSCLLSCSLIVSFRRIHLSFQQLCTCTSLDTTTIMSIKFKKLYCLQYPVCKVFWPTQRTLVYRNSSSSQFTELVAKITLQMLPDPLLHPRLQATCTIPQSLFNVHRIPSGRL